MTLAVMNRRKRVTGKRFDMPSATASFPHVQTVTNYDAEQAVIGAVLQDPEVFIYISETLQAGDFHLMAHGYVWHAFERLAEQNKPIDMITVADELRSLDFTPGNYTKDQLGIWLADMIAKADRVQSAEIYAQIVRDTATRLRGIQAGSEIMHIFADREKYYAVADAIEEADRVLFEATEQRVLTVDTSIRAAVHEYMDMAEASRAGTAPPGIDYGYDNLTQLLGRSVPGEVTVFAGNGGMGKTTFCLGAIRELAKRGKCIGIFTQEQQRSELISALAVMETGIAKKAMKGFDLTPPQWGEFNDAMGRIGTWNVHIVDEFNSMTQVQFRTKVRTLMQAQRVSFDLIFIDGLWLMQWVDDRGVLMSGAKDRPLAVSWLLHYLKSVSKDFGVPIWITQQYNDKAEGREDKRPMLTDLAESSGVKRNAQIIIGLYRDNYYRIAGGSDLTEAHILKDRNGGAQGQLTEFTFNRDRNLPEPYIRRQRIVDFASL